MRPGFSYIRALLYTKLKNFLGGFFMAKEADRNKVATWCANRAIVEATAGNTRGENTFDGIRQKITPLVDESFSTLLQLHENDQYSDYREEIGEDKDKIRDILVDSFNDSMNVIGERVKNYLDTVRKRKDEEAVKRATEAAEKEDEDSSDDSETSDEGDEDDGPITLDE
jgi:hypothetical protein